MTQVLRIALDLLLEAARRKWFVALFAAITLVLLVLGFSLRMDVVDGAIAGSRLFGSLLSDDIVSVNRALQPLYLSAAYVSFYGGALFLAIACSDFAVEMLAPGRIEHLLSLPVARWQLLFGTYLGVIVLAAAGTFYGAGGLTVLLGLKTGEWNARFLAGSTLGWVGFCAIYAAMLSVAFFVRSAALCGAAGIVTLVLGVFASFREAIAETINEGASRTAFKIAMLPFPRFGTLATVSAHLSADYPLAETPITRLVLGCASFSIALLAIAAWRFEEKDF